MTSRLSWFISKKGRLAAGIVATVTSCGAFSLVYLPHTIFLSKYHDLVTMRKYGEPAPIGTKLEKLWHEVLNDLNISDYHKKILKPFQVFGFDVWHAGFLKSKFGAIIGLPVNFTYENVETIEKDEILVNNENVPNWNSKEGQELLASLILSDEAKKYAIAREILMTNNKHILIQSFTTALLIGAFYRTTASINDSMKMFEKPLSLRLLFYILIGSFYWGIWAMQKDTLVRNYEFEVDQQLSALGPAYVNGGHEFYDNMLKRNIALRSLLGAKGQRTFTSKGNENYNLREKHLPITHRKLFFEDKLKINENVA